MNSSQWARGNILTGCGMVLQVYLQAWGHQQAGSDATSSVQLQAGARAFFERGSVSARCAWRTQSSRIAHPWRHVGQQERATVQ